MQPASYKHTAGFHSLITYIIYQALLDLKSRNYTEREDAKDFLLSEDCKFYCEIIELDYRLIERIDFDNLANSLNFTAK